MPCWRLLVISFDLIGFEILRFVFLCFDLLRLVWRQSARVAPLAHFVVNFRLGLLKSSPVLGSVVRPKLSFFMLGSALFSYACCCCALFGLALP